MVLPEPDLLAQAALGERERGFALAFGLGLDQVGQALGLGQVDAPVLERAPSELAGSRWPQSVKGLQRGQHRIDDGPSAMAMELEDVLAGRACRAVEPQN